jgi:hypothetical protein
VVEYRKLWDQSQYQERDEGSVGDGIMVLIAGFGIM